MEFKQKNKNVKQEITCEGFRKSEIKGWFDVH